MGNSDLKISGNSLQLKNPHSPKLVVPGSMSQIKTSVGSPKSSKTPEDNTKSDGSSFSSPSKSAARSPPSTKSSPGSTKSLTVAERLALSTKGKSNTSPKSPVSKSTPISPTFLTSSKTDISKESTDQCLKPDVVEKNIVCNGSVDGKSSNSQLPSGKHSILENSGTSESNEVKHYITEEPNPSEINETDLSVEKDTEKGNCDSNEVTIVDEDSKKINQPLCIDDNIILEQTSKKDIRHIVWEFMEENSLVVYPKPCFNRIPNFKGCTNATQSLEKLEEFKKAKTIQVTPDKAQEMARFLTLNWGKRLLVPLLRLKEGLLQVVSLPFPEPSAKLLKSASTQKGIRKWGNRLITSDNNNEGHHIDMIILGSVAVDKKGHRIGIGNGFCDLEFVILNSMNIVTDNTVIVTIVHDVQVFECIPTDVFKPYDVPVDIIITPTEVIRVEKRIERPKDIFWRYISKRRLLEMPPLQLLRTKQEKDNDIDCTLKDVDSEPEEIPPSPKTFKKPSKRYYNRRSYSTRSENNDSVFKDAEPSKHTSKKSSTVAKHSDTKTKLKKRAKSTSSQQHRSSSSDRHGEKERWSTSKKSNKRRTKSESAKTVELPATVMESKNSNGTQANSPPTDTQKKRRPRYKPRQRILSVDVDKQSIQQSNIKHNGSFKKNNSRSNSRATRRDYIDHQDFVREMSTGRKAHRDYIPSPKKYYSQSRRLSSFSQERQSNSSIRSNSQVQRRDSYRSVVMQHNRHSNGPVIRQTRYFNGPMMHHNKFNDNAVRQNGGNNHHPIRYNNHPNGQFSRQNSFYDGVISHRNSFSKDSIHRGGYANSRVFRPPSYRNGILLQTDERDFIQDTRPHYNNRPAYFNSNMKNSYSRSNNSEEFILKVGNIANNVRVRDLKAALMERGVKPLHITWRGPRGFAYLRYNNSTDMNKDNVVGSLQNVRIKPNGVETAQTQTLIVTECQFS